MVCKMVTIILVGRGLLVKMLITLEKHHLRWSKFACLYIFEIGRQNDKEKKRYKEKNRLRMDSNHCASGCWIRNKPLRPLGHHILYTTLEQGPLTVAVSLPIILIKIKVDQMIPSSYISSLLVSIL